VCRGCSWIALHKNPRIVVGLRGEPCGDPWIRVRGNKERDGDQQLMEGVRTRELKEGSRKGIRRMEAGRKMIEEIEVTRSLEVWESEMGGWNEGYFKP
jgi:hypothetical protein